MMIDSRDDTKASFEYDVFICHASEDKESLVRLLAKELHNKGLNVWYDEFSLWVGDSLRRSIDLGLSKSRHGIVVLSPDFFKKEWPQKELDGLNALEVDGRKVILPIWHNVDKGYVMKYSPMLADRIALFSSNGIDLVVEEILKVIRPKNKYAKLLSDIMQRWLIHGILPSAEELYVIWERIKPTELGLEEMAFLYCSYQSRDQALEEWIESGKPDFSYGHLSDYLAKKANFNTQVLSAYQIINSGLQSYGVHSDEFRTAVMAELTIKDSGVESFALYCFADDNYDRGLEILIMRKINFPTLVRYISKNGGIEGNKIAHKLIDLRYEKH